MITITKAEEEVLNKIKSYDEDKIDVRLVKAGEIKAGEPSFEVDFSE